MLDTITGFISAINDFGRAVADFTHALNDKNTWIRVACFILGVALILAVLWPR